MSLGSDQTLIARGTSRVHDRPQHAATQHRSQFASMRSRPPATRKRIGLVHLEEAARPRSPDASDPRRPRHPGQSTRVRPALRCRESVRRHSWLYRRRQTRCQTSTSSRSCWIDRVGDKCRSTTARARLRPHRLAAPAPPAQTRSGTPHSARRRPPPAHWQRERSLTVQHRAAARQAARSTAAEAAAVPVRGLEQDAQRIRQSYAEDTATTPALSELRSSVSLLAMAVTRLLHQTYLT
jgi:hypothetical protein